MKEVEVHGVNVDFCTQCEGSWFDVGELSDMFALTTRELKHSELAPTRETGGADAVDLEGEIHCPRCGETMDRGPHFSAKSRNGGASGSIKLHQKKYIEKIVERFMPKGPTNVVQRGSLPFSKDFLQNIVDALSQTEVEHPELVKEMQQRIGCLMYAATSTRPDIAFPVHQLCKALHKPTPALIRETDYVLSYLSRHAGVGLTFTAGDSRLTAFADASWETRNSTSGWLVQWQSAALGWGSRKQKSIALSTCEAEIIALSEAAKDCVYFRKFVAGVGAPEPNETPLATDSKSARDTSYNPEHHDKMKHVERRHFASSATWSSPSRSPCRTSTRRITSLNATKFHAMRPVIKFGTKRKLTATASQDAFVVVVLGCHVAAVSFTHDFAEHCWRRCHTFCLT